MGGSAAGVVKAQKGTNNNKWVNNRGRREKWERVMAFGMNK